MNVDLGEFVNAASRLHRLIKHGDTYGTDWFFFGKGGMLTHPDAVEAVLAQLDRVMEKDLGSLKVEAELKGIVERLAGRSGGRQELFVGGKRIVLTVEVLE